MKRCCAVSLGLTDFAQAESLQARLVAARVRGEAPDTILLTSHRPVITLGRSGGREDLLAPPEALAARGIGLRVTHRGGRATYHGPGQLIAYPILDLRRLRPDVHWYLTALERAVVAALADVGVRAATHPGRTGVWVGDGKIASIGIAIRRWVTSHGLALNVAADLDPFSALVPCGLAGVRMTSIEGETGRAPSRSTVERALVEHLGEALGLQIQPRSRQWLRQVVPDGTKRRARAIVPPYGG